jgi:histidinol-phosphate aminotransferase
MVKVNGRHQIPLKERLCALRNTDPSSAPLTPSNVFVGVGSDEAIDALMRCFCVPGRDAIAVCEPTYGMYTVSAAVNDVAVVKYQLKPEDFQLDVPQVQQGLTEWREGDWDGKGDDGKAQKVLLLCSPGNPTGALLRRGDVDALLATPGWNGVVVVDEAYVDFSGPGPSSVAQLAASRPNLVVLQTLSKGFGLAGARVGVAFASAAVARLLNALKAPYNVSSLASRLATAALEPANLAVTRANVSRVLAQRARLLDAIGGIEGVGRLRGGLDSNFLLVEFVDGRGEPSNAVAKEVYERLAGERGVVVRFRGNERWCEGCLRITVGTEAEVDRFVGELTDILPAILEKSK